MQTNDEKIRQTYLSWIECWNSQNPDAMEQLLTEHCNLIGFDGSQMNGRQEVISVLSGIFSQFPTARFVTLIREIRLITPTVAILRAEVGMVPRGGVEINPAVNAVQVMTAVEQGDVWKMSVFQNTPAAFHGRPELIIKLTQELNDAAKRPQGLLDPEKRR